MEYKIKLIKKATLKGQKNKYDFYIKENNEYIKKMEYTELYLIEDYLDKQDSQDENLAGKKEVDFFNNILDKYLNKKLSESKWPEPVIKYYIEFDNYEHEKCFIIEKERDIRRCLNRGRISNLLVNLLENIPYDIFITEETSAIRDTINSQKELSKYYNDKKFDVENNIGNLERDLKSKYEELIEKERKLFNNRV